MKLTNCLPAFPETTMKKMLILIFSAVITFTFAFNMPVMADSSCKGKAKSQCEGDNDCTWVDGYKRKDGVSVDAYCRSKPSKSEGSKKSKKKKESSEANDDKGEKKETKKKKSSKKEKVEKDKDDKEEGSKKKSTKKKKKKSKKDKDSE